MGSEIFVANDLPQQIFTTNTFLNGALPMNRHFLPLDRKPIPTPRCGAKESRRPSLAEHFYKHSCCRVRKVQFDSLITVRSYNTVLGDNPSVSDGPPISIGWEYTTKQLSMVSLDDYLDGGRTTKSASNPNEYHLDATTRFERLERNGISKRDVESSVVEINRIKRSRRANSIRSKVMVVTGAPSSKIGDEPPRAKQGGSLTWAITPQRSRLSPGLSRRASLSIRQHQTKTPFPKPMSLSLPSL